MTASPIKQLKVNLGDRSYPICIGAGTLAESALLRSFVLGNQLLVVTNETVAPLYLEKINSAFVGLAINSLVLPDGEKHKNLSTLNSIFDCLLEYKHNRTTTLVALGGGVVGDLTGFAAACYQRGVNFIQIPTTLLAQVDSSVGGKTGVNHPLGKNMIGAFHQPKAVIIDVNTLTTLPDREFRSGLAEVIKYGLISDCAFFAWLEAHIVQLLERDPALLTEAIEISCRNKAAVVAKDEREGGLRAILNLGHTFGHAIETHEKYMGMLHGEAVAVGMLMAATMSNLLGLINVEDVNRTRQLLTRAGLPISPPSGLGSETFMELMAVDKKAVNGSIRLVLLKAIGNAFVTGNYDRAVLEKTIALALRSA